MEATFEPRVCGEVGAVGVGDGVHDGRPEAVSVGMPRSSGVEPREGLEGGGRPQQGDHGSGVLIENRAAPSAVAVAISIHPPGRLYRMALSTRFATTISARRGSPVARAGERGVDLDSAAFGVLMSLFEHMANEVCKVEGFPLADAALAAGQGQQRLDQPFLLLAEGQLPPRW